MGYSIDSRTLNAGDLFIAIAGEHFDGHNYVQAALEKGAVGAIVEAGKKADGGSAAVIASGRFFSRRCNCWAPRRAGFGANRCWL